MSFSTEGQFLGLKNGRLHLHKPHGLVTAVPVSLISEEDLEYVKNIIGDSISLECQNSGVQPHTNYTIIYLSEAYRNQV